ncbi:MAG: class II fructose-bisphosphate aldolase [bacterium]
MIVPAKELLDFAYKKFSVGAYNIHNLEQLMGLLYGSQKSNAPFIVQAYPSTLNYTDASMLEALFHEADKLFPDLIFAVSIDHGDEATCMRAIDSGAYSHVMIDASMETFEKNIEITKRVVDHAHSRGVSVEGMVGKLGGLEKHMKVLDVSEVQLTTVEQAREFAERTGCDSLAVSIGTLHGANKAPDGIPRKVDLDRLKEIGEALEGTPLVMHGSSCLPQEEVRRVDAAGGKLERVGGMDETQQSEVHKLGVAQINVNSDGLLIWTRSIREYLRDYPGVIDLRESGKAFMQEYASFIAHKNDVFGSSGKLDALTEHYETPWTLMN